MDKANGNDNFAEALTIIKQLIEAEKLIPIDDFHQPGSSAILKHIKRKLRHGNEVACAEADSGRLSKISAKWYEEQKVLHVCKKITFPSWENKDETDHTYANEYYTTQENMRNVHGEILADLQRHPSLKLIASVLFEQTGETVGKNYNGGHYYEVYYQRIIHSHEMRDKAIENFKIEHASKDFFSIENMPEWDVYVNCFRYLGITKQLVDVLISYMKEPNSFTAEFDYDSDISKSAVTVLRKITEPMVLISSWKEYSSSRNSNRLYVLRKIEETLIERQIADNTVVEGLIATLKDENSNVRLMAARTLFTIVKKNPIRMALTHGRSAQQSILNKSSIHSLISAVNDEEFRVRHEIVKLLANITDSDMIDPLIAATKDESWYVREEAVKALVVEIKDNRIFEILISVLMDNSPHIRQIAVTALCSKGIRSVEPLINALLDRRTDFITTTGVLRGILHGADAVGSDEEQLRKWWDQNKSKYCNLPTPKDYS